MTRRIAIAILLTSWAILLIGGAVSYVSVRRVLLAELDGSIVLRASSLPEVLGIRGLAGKGAAVPAGDRYVVKIRRGQTLARPAAAPVDARPATVLSKSFATLADGTRARTVTLSFPTDDAGKELTVVYSGSAVRFDEVLRRLAWVALGIAAGASAVVAGVAVGVARVAMRPLRVAAQQLTTIDDRTLDRRLDVTALPEEMRPVGERMNQLLARLEQGIGERKRFLADAAHELRTPVTALTTTIEVALRRPRDVTALVATLNDCLSDAHVLRRLVGALLEQFHLDSQPGVAAMPEEVDVSEILDLCANSMTTMAGLKGVTLVRSYEAGLRFRVHPDRLRSVVGNLLSNGIEYNHAGGTVDLAARVEANAITIVVADDGPGIAEVDRPHVFEPFYRAGASRAADGAAGHAGIGLYLVKSHVAAMGGTCELDRAAERGASFRVTIPGPTEPPIAQRRGTLTFFSRGKAKDMAGVT